MINWGVHLDPNERGIARPTLANACKVLHVDPLYGPERLWYDTFLERVLVANSPTRQWRDDDDTRLTVHMQTSCTLPAIVESVVASAVRYVARQRERHCVCEWLDTLTWDDEPRIDASMETYWGAEASAAQPVEYLRAVGRNFWLGLVARVRHPGCQLDTMPVFEGAQGIGKSQALRLIGGDWYMLAAESVTGKDFFQSLPGKWLVEVGELDAFSRAERERVKVAISTPTDRYRASYGRHAIDHPRQCLFAGTTNREEWGNDDTGLRRFWPIRCGAIDIPALTRDRAQLFAEASIRLAGGATWWEMPGSTLAVQADRQVEDAWTLTVLEWLFSHQEATSAEILVGALKFRESDITRSEQLRIGSILRLAGWTRRTVRRSGQPVKAWANPA